MTTKVSRTYLAICTVLALGVSNAAFAGAGHKDGHQGGHQGGHKGGQGPSLSELGKPGDPKAATRTLEVLATDYAFDISTLTVKDGETVRFVIRNTGEFLHEFNIGTPAMHAEHQAEMIMMMEHGMMTPTKINHNMINADHSRVAMNAAAGTRSDAPAGVRTHMKHDDPNSILLEPGESKELVWTFARTASLEFACNLPGHYEVGMMGKISFTN